MRAAISDGCGIALALWLRKLPITTALEPPPTASFVDWSRDFPSCSSSVMIEDDVWSLRVGLILWKNVMVCRILHLKNVKDLSGSFPFRSK